MKQSRLKVRHKSVTRGTRNDGAPSLLPPPSSNAPLFRFQTKQRGPKKITSRRKNKTLTGRPLLRNRMRRHISQLKKEQKREQRFLPHSSQTAANRCSKTTLTAFHTRPPNDNGLTPLDPKRGQSTLRVEHFVHRQQRDTTLGRARRVSRTTIGPVARPSLSMAAAARPFVSVAASRFFWIQKRPSESRKKTSRKCSSFACTIFESSTWQKRSLRFSQSHCSGCPNGCRSRIRHRPVFRCSAGCTYDGGE